MILKKLFSKKLWVLLLMIMGAFCLHGMKGGLPQYKYLYTMGRPDGWSTDVYANENGKMFHNDVAPPVGSSFYKRAEAAADLAAAGAAVKELETNDLRDETIALPGFIIRDIKCSFCERKYKDCERIALLACGHTFHPTCMNSWLSILTCCPKQFCAQNVTGYPTIIFLARKDDKDEDDEETDGEEREA